MDISLFSLWFVCGLGTASFAALAPVTAWRASAGVLAFIIGAWWMRLPLAPGVSAVALATALLAAAYLLRAPRPTYALAFAGLLAGFWTDALNSEGVPLAAAAVVAAAVPIISSRLRTIRPAYAPAPLREEALLFMIVLGVIGAAAPGVTEGWRAAANLSIQGASAPTATAVAIPAWTIAVAAAALLSGATYSLWSRR